MIVLLRGNITGKQYKVKVSGTPTNEHYAYYGDSINSMFTEISGTYTRIALKEGDIDSLKTQLKALETELLDKEVKFVNDYPDSPVSLRIVDYISRDAKSDSILKYVSLLSERQQALPSMTKLVERAEVMRKTEEGAVAPLFTLNDDKGNAVNLVDYRGKYLLVDFWASWCGPCRASFPMVAGLYKKYAGEKFDILGVSLDQDESAWRKALADEQCAWTQVVDLKGDVAKEYAVSTIPMMLLVAPDGTICGKYNKTNIADKLAELFD